MPFTRANFGPIGGQSRAGSGAEGVPGTPQMWSHRSSDAATVVDTTGYLNPVRDLVEVGDLIYHVQVDGAGALVAAGWHIVRTKTAAAVDLTNVLAATVANTD